MPLKQKRDNYLLLFFYHTGKYGNVGEVIIKRKTKKPNYGYVYFESVESVKRVFENLVSILPLITFICYFNSYVCSFTTILDHA